jgi:hypothetical protein
MRCEEAFVIFPSASLFSPAGSPVRANYFSKSLSHLLITPRKAFSFDFTSFTL